MNDINKKIIGTWRLVYSIEIDAQGHKTYPFGDDAIGYIMYDQFGKMTVQICRKNRTLHQANEFKNSAQHELAHIPQDYLAYFGHYEIDLEQQIVSHRVEGALFPNIVGKILKRKYYFYDDKMSLKPWDGTNREILWQKISATRLP